MRGLKALKTLVLMLVMTGVAFSAGNVTQPMLNKFPIKLAGIAESFVIQRTEEEVTMALLVKDNGIQPIDLPKDMSKLADKDLRWVVILHLKGPLVNYDLLQLLVLPMSDGIEYTLRLQLKNTKEVTMEFIDMRDKVEPPPKQAEPDDEDEQA